jgi:glycosyltransferase involved in cell wall biosynthesis
MLNTIQEYSNKGCSFNFLVSEMNQDIKESIRLVEELNLRRFYSTVLNKVIKIENILKELPIPVREKVSLYLPLKKKRFDGIYSCYQLDKKMKRLSTQFPDLNLKPIEGLDQYDPRISPDLELEPVTKPLLAKSISTPDKIKISVIIPAYNNQNYIQNNIRHLSQQTLNKEEFELILVNDGSSDNTGERIKQMLNSLPPMNYKYFYVPRPRKRFMGDAQFRAGIARNLGVKHASGKYISFLDADMITPHNYLENLLVDLQSHDVIQTQRHYLKGQISTNLTNYDDLLPERDTYVPERGYWHEFYNDKREWNEIDVGWKYVCTYSLTMAKEDFLNVGWFRKTYMFYGFEDTDLGYRLFKRDKKFKLSPMRIYHLFQHNERSEYSNSEYLRQALLSKTAQIFYRNYLDDEIFFHLKSLINDGPGLEDFIPNFRS